MTVVKTGVIWSTVGRDMTLRDYFAAKAIGAAAEWEIAFPTGHHDEACYRGAADRAYLMADAMLAAREVK